MSGILTIFILGAFYQSVDAAPDSLAMASLEQKARYSYRSSLDSSIYYAQEILTLCEQDDHSYYHAFALNWIGICLMREGYPDSAETYYQQTIHYGSNNEVNKFVQMARLNRSINYFQQGKFEQAAEAAEVSMHSFESIGDSLGVAHAQYNLANSLQQLDRLDEALTFYRAVLPVYELKGSALNRANLYNAIGSIQNLKGKYDSAILQYKKSIAIKVSVGGANFCASEYINIANTLKNMGESDSAIYYYHKSHRTAALLGDQGKVANAYVDLSEQFNVLEESDSAIHYAKKALEIARNIKDDYTEYVGLYQLSLAYANQEKFKKAYEFHTKFIQARDSVQNIEIEERVSELEKKYQLAQKDQELLESSLEIQEKNAAIQLQVSLILFLLLIVIVTTLWYNARRKKQLILHRLTLNNERNRIAMDLHDHLGAELTIISSKLDTKIYNTERTSDKEELNNISEQVRDAGKTLRETVWSIQNESIDLSQLIQKTQGFANQLLEASSIQFKVNESIDQLDLTPQIALDLFRICQEAITNAFKYANPQNITLDVFNEEGNMVIRLSDDGTGFDTESEATGFGIGNMQRRSEQIGARLSIQSQSQEGTSVVITLPGQLIK